MASSHRDPHEPPPQFSSGQRDKTSNLYYRNLRDVWTVAHEGYPGAHFATFPPKLITPCILAGSPPGGTILDPFAGAGTTGLVASALGRDAILIELNPDYVAMAQQRLADASHAAE